jgi:uncharacterized membrane protein YadS
MSDEGERVEVVRGVQTLWKTEDWWAVWMAFIVIGIALVCYYTNAISLLKTLAVSAPGKWTSWDQVTAYYASNWTGYIVNFIFWAVIFTISSKILGFKVSEFLPSFIFVYIVSILIFLVAANETAHKYNIEPPILAVILGLILSNLFRFPKWMDAGFRVEYYIKTGIVLLGATLPFSLIYMAGPYVIGQAAAVAITAFLLIFYLGQKFGLDKRTSAVLGAGGAVCGVSASIAMAAAVRAKKEDYVLGIAAVIIMAIVAIFLLPLAAMSMNPPMHPGEAGAWIGTSEFADAAGFAAADWYGTWYVDHVSKVVGGADARDLTLWAYTLMKVIGRDIWIGLWAFVMAIVSTTRWEAEETGARPSAMEIWWRFPKFVLGFLAASLLMTLVVGSVDTYTYLHTMKPNLIGPIKTMRTWTFIFTFFSIGMTTRFREFVKFGARPWATFFIGAAVVIVFGFILSHYIFGPIAWVRLPEWAPRI